MPAAHVQACAGRTLHCRPGPAAAKAQRLRWHCTTSLPYLMVTAPTISTGLLITTLPPLREMEPTRGASASATQVQACMAAGIGQDCIVLADGWDGVLPEPVAMPPRCQFEALSNTLIGEQTCWACLRRCAL